MASVQEIMQLCRLCLIKDEVNTPIFEDVEDINQVFLKIAACLPIKVSREDSLPKRICNSCSYKLELFYEFSNTSTASEKQLLKWLNQLNVDKQRTSKITNTMPSSNSIIFKQEVPELLETHSEDLVSDDLNISSDAQDYDLPQQQLPYESVEFEFQQEGFLDNDASASISTAVRSHKRQAAVLESSGGIESDDDDIGLSGSKMAKTEDDIDSENETVQSTFVDLPSTSGDNDQPGPSGVGKATADAPFRPLTAIISDVQQRVYECEVCTETFATRKDFLAHHMNQFGQTFTCCRCNLRCKTTTELYNHYELHKNNTIIIEEDNDDSTEYDYSDNVETVISIPNEPTNDTNELLYILDGSQCVNEIVIEDENDIQETEPSESSHIKSENFKIVHIEHGYMLPTIFKGQLDAKRRYTRRESVSETGIGIEIEEEPPETAEVTSTKPTYLNIPKARPKRRHEVPDFSATNYIVLNPNEEIDMIHYQCLRCEQLFISKFTFFRHIEKGKCYVNSCDVCSASFIKNCEFYEHYLAEHTDRAICNFCFRTFMYEKNVKEHMLRHLDQFRHRCEECNKGFYTVREYRNHYKNRHMGIRHKCDVCGRSFADEYYFKRHVATHEKALKK